MEELLEICFDILLLPYYWWQHHNQSSTLGTCRDEEEAEEFWLKFTVIGGLFVAAGFLAWNFWHPA